MIYQFTEEHEFLSNFWACRVKYGRRVYPSAEHAYQASKTLDERERKDIRLAYSPARAKEIGKRVTLRPDWSTNTREFAMYEVLSAKFKGEDLELAKMLVDTGNEILCEGNNWHDNYWGDCFCPRCKHIVGANTLGDLLMIVRDEVRFNPRIRSTNGL